MAIKQGRPSAELTIEDCRSCTIVSNPSLRCEHGLHFREQAWKSLPKRIRDKVCQEPQCEAEEWAPHVGERIVLRVCRSIAEREEIAERIQNGQREAEERWHAEHPGEAEVPADVRIVASLGVSRQILTERVLDWTWTGPDGERLPLPSEDPDKVRRSIELAEVFWIVEAIQAGMDPREAVLDLGNGDAG